MCDKTKNNQTQPNELFCLNETLEELSIITDNKNEEKVRLEDVIIHMETAYSWAKRRCYAKRRKVGAIVVKNNKSISSGFNGTKPGYPNICEKDNVTLPTVIHAEKNALSKLFIEGVSAKDSAMFVTTLPCSNCAEDIVLAGVSSVYFTEFYRSIDGAIELIKNNISVYHVDLKKIQDYDREVEEFGSYDYQSFPRDFLTPIYLSQTDEDNQQSKNNIALKKLNAINKLKELYSDYYDGKYHFKFYDVSN